ncbi:MAG TPA: ThiF family adenylyltransferase, partial [Rudaea sp.]|nr:ThiF family adenylyltransferase [Rudaea sp.]
IALNALNPGVRVDTVAQRLLAQNVEDLIRDHDVVIDGADNFPTRYLLDAACRRLRIPLVYGAVHRFTGQVSVFDARRDDSPCYRCLFPEPPAAADAPNCAEAGVLGVLPGIIGLLQANEAIKLLLGIGHPLIGRLLCFDALAGTFRELRLPRDPQCPGCGANAKFSGYQDIEQVCSAHPGNAE